MRHPRLGLKYVPRVWFEVRIFEDLFLAIFRQPTPCLMCVYVVLDVCACVHLMLDVCMMVVMMVVGVCTMLDMYAFDKNL